MKVLVACEESQVVTCAFRERGHEAYSCDIEPCSGGHPEWHIHDDVMNHIDEDWALMIAHPPCTHLCSSGARWFKEKIRDGRQQQALRFVKKLMDSPVPKICIENPIGILSTFVGKPDQIIRPCEYGENSTKSTCLWLKGLPLLSPTNIVTTTRHTTKSGKSYDDWWFQTSLISDLKERSRIRSKTFPGIARAMAEQWG